MRIPITENRIQVDETPIDAADPAVSRMIFCKKFAAGTGVAFVISGVFAIGLAPILGCRLDDPGIIVIFCSTFIVSTLSNMHAYACRRNPDEPMDDYLPRELSGGDAETSDSTRELSPHAEVESTSLEFLRGNMPSEPIGDLSDIFITGETAATLA